MNRICEWMRQWGEQCCLFLPILSHCCIGVLQPIPVRSWRKWFLLSVGCCLFSWAVAQETMIKKSVSKFVSLLSHIEERKATDIAEEFQDPDFFLGNGERQTLATFLDKYKRSLKGFPMTHELILNKEITPLGTGDSKRYYLVKGRVRRYRRDRENPDVSVCDVSFTVKFNGSGRPVTLVGCNLPFMGAELSRTVLNRNVGNLFALDNPPIRLDWSTLRNYKGLGELIKSQMDLFCEYISDVGSTNLSDEQKVRIINQGVPGLFFNYSQYSRKMITSVGNCGEGRVRKPMATYFINLKDQAIKGPFAKRVYQLSNCFSSGNLNELPDLQFVRKLPNGSLLYRTFAVYDQVMSDLDTSRKVEGQVIRKEHDRKRMEILIEIKPSRRISAYLGDIVEVDRVN